MADERVKKILDRHKKLKAEKQPWLSTYQLIGEYVMTRKQDFTGQHSQGEFLTGKIFDSTAPSALHQMASSLIGALWPNGAKTFEIKPSLNLPKEVAESEEVKTYFEKVTLALTSAMDSPKAGFLTSLEEYMLDQGAFGISGIGVFENDQDNENPLMFIAVDAKKISIDEGADGFVDTVYIEKEVTVKQLVQEYGIENVSPKTRDAAKNGRLEDKVKVLHAIEPRIEGLQGTFGNMDMPVASIHIEVVACHVLKEAGYEQMPVFITRFWKAMGEKYGRSPAMEAMPDILEANALREAAIIATEKMLDPPLLVNHDGSLGGGTIDTSAGAINVRNITGRIGDQNQRAIEPLVTVGEMNSTFKRITELKEIIQNNFFVDRLIDLNNETRMTLGEAQIRNELRGQSLGTIYARQIAELFNRCIERAFNIMLSRGLLGVPNGSEDALYLEATGYAPLIIPDSIIELMVNGKDFLRIDFISPAARIMRLEELTGIERTVQFALGVAAALPDALDMLDVDTIVKDVQNLTGAPARILHSLQRVEEIRNQRAQQQQQMMELQAAQMQADTAKSAGQALQAGSAVDQEV